MELFDAIASGDEARVAALLSEDPSRARARHASGVSALTWALYRHRHVIAQRLLPHAGDLDVFEAAALGDRDRVAALLERDPTLVDAWSPDGFTALHLAAFFGHPAAARLLIDRGADAGAISRNPMRLQPLHSAVAARQCEIAAMLLDAGAAADARQQGGWTPLHAAAQHGDAALAELLLARGADLTLASDDGRDALALAAERGDAETLALLRQAAPGYSTARP